MDVCVDTQVIIPDSTWRNCTCFITLHSHDCTLDKNKCRKVQGIALLQGKGLSSTSCQKSCNGCPFSWVNADHYAYSVVRNGDGGN